MNLVLNNPTPASVPADGWIVGYKILGDPGAYTVVGPFVSTPININIPGDPNGTLYEGYIQRDCGDLTSTFFFWQTPCDCSGNVGYVESPGGDQCQLNETTAPTITNSGFCLAATSNSVYTSFESRIYNAGFDNTTINLAPATVDPDIFADLTLDPQWANPTLSAAIGPLNREAVWIDSDCNGTPNALGSGVQTTIGYVFNNVGATRTIFVGVGADNQFQVVVNGVEIADSGIAGDVQFKIWHILPITVVPGSNFINIIGTGDGTVNDAIGMVIYDNTAAQIAAATSDIQLNIPFATHQLVGTSFDVATCPATYSLDMSGGQGNFICRRTTYALCNANL